MVMLFCTILGQAGRPFAVKIARTETVAALKRAIMAEDLNPLEDIEAEQLQLFLAVVPGGRKWLRDGSASVYDLTGGRLNNSIRTMIAGPNILPDKRTLKDV
ncbi:hypothetical protein DVH05_006269 [Phytophthora capsici]|nr:hypothetical protein DVH05_006269 [Phytophthora capsici]